MKNNRIHLSLTNELFQLLLASAKNNPSKIQELIRQILEEYYGKGSTAKDLFKLAEKLERSSEATRLLLVEIMDETAYSNCRLKLSTERNRNPNELYEEKKAIQQHQADRRLDMLKIWETK